MSPRASAATAEIPIPAGPDPSAATHSCSAEYFSSATTFAICVSFSWCVKGERGSAQILRKVRERPRGLLLALVERQGDDFERLRLAPEVDVQGGAGFGVF